MYIPEHTFSPEATAALTQAFAPFMVDAQGDALGLDERTAALPRTRLAMAHALEHCLALECGATGRAILEQLDGVANGGGYPALLLHGLPHDHTGGEGISYMITEAWMALLQGHAEAKYHTVVIDTHASHESPGYTPDGFRGLHHDVGPYTLLYGLEGGANPRHTVIFDAQELVQHLTQQWAHQPALRAEKAAAFLQLLQEPIWPITNEKMIPAQDRPMIRREGRFCYTPMLYPNPDYHPQEPGSSTYRFIPVAFETIKDRVLSPDRHYFADPAMRKAVHELSKLLYRATSVPVAVHQGPVLGTGDLLLINNALAIHAGGPYVHAQLDSRGEKRPRALHSLDMQGDGRTYPVRPGDRWVNAIVPDEGAHQR